MLSVQFYEIFKSRSFAEQIPATAVLLRETLRDKTVQINSIKNCDLLHISGVKDVMFASHTIFCCQRQRLEAALNPLNAKVALI